MTDRELLRKTRAAKRHVAYHTQWRNEPRNARALRLWQGRLRRLKKEARARGLELESPKPPPPPPPPTPLEEAQARAVLPWQPSPGIAYWSPWGDRGWVPVILIDKHRTRGDARKVNPKTGEIRNGVIKVRLGRLVRRDPTAAGKDKPRCRASELWPPEDETPGEERELWPEPAEVTPRTEEQLAVAAELLELIQDKSTVEDW